MRTADTLRAQLPSRKIEIELTTAASNYHVELNPSDAGYQDRYVVQEIIKARAQGSGALVGSYIGPCRVGRRTAMAQGAGRMSRQLQAPACTQGAPGAGPRRWASPGLREQMLGGALAVHRCTGGPRLAAPALWQNVLLFWPDGSAAPQVPFI